MYKHLSVTVNKSYYIINLKMKGVVDYLMIMGRYARG